MTAYPMRVACRGAPTGVANEGGDRAVVSEADLEATQGVGAADSQDRTLRLARLREEGAEGTSRDLAVRLSRKSGTRVGSEAMPWIQESPISWVSTGRR